MAAFDPTVYPVRFLGRQVPFQLSLVAYHTPPSPVYNAARLLILIKSAGLNDIPPILLNRFCLIQISNLTDVTFSIIVPAITQFILVQVKYVPGFLFKYRQVLKYFPPETSKSDNFGMSEPVLAISVSVRKLSQAEQSSREDWWVSSIYRVIWSDGKSGLVSWKPRIAETLSVSLSLPCSTSSIMPAEVMLLLNEAIRKEVSLLTGSFRSQSRQPKLPRQIVLPCFVIWREIPISLLVFTKLVSLASSWAGVMRRQPCRKVISRITLMSFSIRQIKIYTHVLMIIRVKGGSNYGLEIHNLKRFLMAQCIHNCIYFIMTTNITVDTISGHPEQLRQFNSFTTLPLQSACNCRICLQPCNQAMYCLCRGDLQIHQQCLLQFLKRKPSGPDFQYCQICKQKYNLIYETIWKASCKYGCQNFTQRLTKCIVYICVFAFSLGYLSFYTYLMLMSNTVVLRVITSIVAGCVTLIFLACLCLWVYEFFLVFRMIVAEVKEYSGDSAGGDARSRARARQARGFFGSNRIVNDFHR